MIDHNKQYRTRDGREVRLYATDGEKYNEIHGAMAGPFGWAVTSWPKNGRYFSEIESEKDLIEVKPRIQREYWVNLYENERTCYFHLSKTDADMCQGDDRIACIKWVIDCEEGEGL